MAKLVVDSDSLVSVADAIRTKGNTTDELEFPNGFVDGINAIESGGGGTEEIENIIDASGVLESTDGTATEKVEQLIERVDVFSQSMTISFSGNQTIERIDFYLSKAYGSLGNCFRDCTNLKFLVGINTSKAVNVTRLLQNSAVEEIQRPFDFSSVTSSSNAGAFAGANSLREVRIVDKTMKWGNTISSGVLSNESIKSIIDGLATVETTQTLTLHADVKAKLTDEQLATITGKNWSVA